LTTVTLLHDNLDTDLADLKITDGSGHRAVVHTTQNHPFWDVTTGKWTAVDQLEVGDQLNSPNHGAVRVESVRKFARRQHMYNLTVADVHTFYVIANGTPILVYNVCHNMHATLVVRDGRESACRVTRVEA